MACCFFILAVLLVFLGFSGLPMLLLGGIARADQFQCALIAKDSSKMPYIKHIHNSAANIKILNITIPTTPFLAQHVIRIKGSSTSEPIQVLTTVYATNMNYVKDFTPVPVTRRNSFLVDFRAKKQMFPRGCATLEVEIFVPREMDSIMLNIPSSASLSFDSVITKNLVVNQVVVNRKKFAKKACRGWKHWAGGKLLGHVHHGRHHHHEATVAGKKPQKPQNDLSILMAPKNITISRSVLSTVKMTGAQKVVILDSKCNSNAAINIAALHVNMTSVLGCSQLTIASQQVAMEKVVANKLTINGVAGLKNVENYITLGNMDVKSIAGTVNGGKVTLKMKEGTLLELNKHKRGEIKVLAEPMEWITNQDNEKLGKYKCTTECKYDIKFEIGRGKATVSA
jgi:hypothetical protein